MKLYDFRNAPNPRRVAMFIHEKGLDIPRVEIDLGNRGQLDPSYANVNPYQQVPALELDDGTVLTESTAICLYLERLHPEPCLMGTTPLEQAQILMWDRRMEINGQMPVADAFRNSSPFFKGRAMSGPDNLEQIPALAERGRLRVTRFMERLDGFLEGKPFVAGETFSIADITAFVATDFARVIKMKPPAELANLTRWFAEMAARPSAVATAAK